MKNIIYLFILSLISLKITAQSTTDFKRDSTEKAQRNALLKLDKEGAALEKERNDVEKTAKKEEDQSSIDLIKAQKELLSTSTPTALSGNVTISKAETAMAETRALVYISLHKLISNFLAELTKNSCNRLPCQESIDSSKDDSTKKDNAKKEIKKIPIIIFNSDLYQTFPEYETLVEQIKLLSQQYGEQTNEFDNKVNTGEAAGEVVGPIAIAQAVIESLINLATLFRADTEFKVNNEIITEETLVAKFRQLDICCYREYFYPSLFPLKITSTSSLLTALKEIDQKRSALLAKIKKFKDEKIDAITKKLDVSRKEKKLKEDALKKSKNDAEKKSIKENISKLQQQIKIDSSNIIKFTNRIKPLDDNVSKLNEVFEGIKTSLSSIVDEKAKTTLLRKLLIAESILDKINNSGAYSLRLVASGIGTNRIKKSLFGSSLKHSAFTEINFMLFKDRELIYSQLETDYKPLVKSKDIN